MRKMSNSAEILEVVSKIANRITLALPLAVSRSSGTRSVGLNKLKETESIILDAMDRFEGEILDQFPDAPVPPKRPKQESAD